MAGTAEAVQVVGIRDLLEAGGEDGHVGVCVLGVPFHKGGPSTVP